MSRFKINGRFIANTVHHPGKDTIAHHPFHSEQGQNLSIMENRFRSMRPSDPKLFLVRQLNTSGMKTDMPSEPIRSQIHCFFFVSKGESLITIGDKSYLFKENECAVIPAGQVFLVRYYNDCKGYMGGFHTDFLNADTEGKNLLRTFAFLRKWGGHKVLFDEEHGSYIQNIFSRLYTEQQGKKNADILKAYLIALLVEVDEAYNKISDSQESEAGVNNQLCNNFIEFAFANPDLSKSVSFHADRLNVSAGHLQKVLKRLTGKTPLAWISEAVVLEAKTLLLHTDLPISMVAERIGITDPSYFARIFKKSTGLSPARFRGGSNNA